MKECEFADSATFAIIATVFVKQGLPEKTAFLQESTFYGKSPADLFLSSLLL